MSYNHYMLLNTDHLTLFFIGLVLNGLVAIPLINLLYRNKFYKTKTSDKVDTSKRNPNYYNHLLSNMDTPSSFGILLLLDLVFFQMFFGSTQTLVLMLVLAVFTLLGFLDDVVKYFGYEKVKRWGLTTGQKLVSQFIIVVLLLYLISVPSLFILPFTLLFIVFITNSVNIVDGLDGLVGTLCMYIFPVLGYFEISSHNNVNLVNLVIILFSFLFVFLYFNIKPARVFLGDAGSMPLGFFIAFLGLRYNLIPIFVLFSLIIVDGLSSLIQMFSIRYLKRKVFVIAPLHLHLLNKGWADTKIVQRAGIIQLVLSFIAIYLFRVL
ncbi:MAG: Phospho-N-acetylmuramoyl-pentapeptide-transferase [candidate division WWE3 bacterium GW2011_GWC1_41_7]|uniref:Phospho-N-acetylmuramoyl-pentapeptide-transferase n=4 Tax=Katanobacteria TaxID=422282 RepID=A0A0G0X567_UNCKA|nr:MAG: Phospho-N-acetylmuramoyl-pentapeptide-transferase [candidate division WWE3 bacterium GW2011_GWC1_41_7]OGC57745.1 MAG: hypothetical protein A2976_02300 [candidate division WWE3 bacterium RIFCSPLOWO2_01_FULL_41_9]